MESDNSKLVKAAAKAILHFNQGRDARHVKLVDRSEASLAIISADTEAEKLKMALEEILMLESKWNLAVSRITRFYNPGVEVPDADLAGAIKDVFTLNTQLTESRKRWGLLLQDFPFVNKRLAPIKAAIENLQRISDRIIMVQKPSEFADHPDIKHIQETQAKIDRFRKDVDTLSNAIIANKAELDATIEQTVENYKPERIDPVDRAILRLGTYEIFFKEDIPAPVTINECIEISRRFGSDESPRFINGVLDKISKID